MNSSNFEFLHAQGKKDELFSYPNYPKPFAFNEQVAQAFDDMIFRSVPLYKEVNSAIIQWARNLAAERPYIYDLGCSTGTTILNLGFNIEKSCNFFGIDASEPMLLQAQEKLNLLPPRHRFKLELATLENVEMHEAHMVILNYTMQFLKVNNRSQLMKKIYSKLKNQGILFLSEKIKFDDPWFHETATFIYEDFKKRSGYSDIEIARKKEALENVLIPYTKKDLLKMLEDSGFKAIETILQWNNFITIVARKDA